MKKLILILTILALIAVPIMSLPAAADDSGFTEVNKSFSIDSDEGHRIPEGSTVHHLRDGITKVFGPDKSLILKAKDTESSEVNTPNGPKKATHVFGIPNESRIKQTAKGVLEVYQGDSIVLTIIDENPVNENLPSPFTKTDSWIECCQSYQSDSNPTTIQADYTYARWNVPATYSPESNTIIYIFNGFTPSNGAYIVQPVLEYNRWSQNSWTCTAWYVSSQNELYSQSHVPAWVGDEVEGGMQSQGGDDWMVSIDNYTQGGETASRIFYDTSIYPSGLLAFWALEGYNIYNDGDAPASITFTDIEVTYNGNPVNYTGYAWESSDWEQILTSINPYWISSTSARLYVYH